MGAAQQSTLRPGQVIVHHLSDLNYQENTNNPDNRLLTYQRYLDGLPDDRYPDVVVITGNLTATGSEKELRAVVAMLLGGFSRWNGLLREHIFIVPGPQDVNWEVLNNVGLKTFYTLFKPFATPYHTDKPEDRLMPDGRAYPAIESESFVGYAIDTCYAPAELDAELKTHYKRYTKDFGRFVKRRGRVGARVLGMWKRPGRLTRKARVKAREDALKGLQAGFLSFTEGTRPLDLRMGRVPQADIDRFNAWVDSLEPNTQPPNAPLPNTQPPAVQAPPPLKMLITHHPLAIRANEDSGDTEAIVAQRSFAPLLNAARDAGVHLMLHGHSHNGDIIIEQSEFQKLGSARTIRQLGAASLAKTGVFNEITAVYREDQNQAQGQSQRPGEWEFTVLTLNLSAAGPVAPRGTPGNQAALADKQIKRLKRAADQRSDFERVLQYAMRRFSEQVHSVRKENLQSNSQRVSLLPQEALLVIRDAISGVIFKGLETHVRLLLKSNDPGNGPIPRLVPTYLAPAMMDGPDTVVYPASIAAWSLVLGVEMIYSDLDRAAFEKKPTTAEDHEWLRRSNKIKDLLLALEALEKEATNTNAVEEGKRYKKLHDTLEEIKGGPTNFPDAKILGETMFRNGTGKSPLRGWPTFICLPYPTRPEGGAPPKLPEIAVLEVGVRPVESPDPDDTSPMPAGLFRPFTPNRIAMLEVVTDLIGMMLITGDALGRPPGIWNDSQWSSYP